MIAGEAAFFVLVNGLVAFTIALGLAAVLARRLAPGGLRLAVLVAPFVKLALTLAHGIPGDAFFWARMRGVRQELGSFLVGVGIDRVGVRLALGLQSHAAGLTWPSTVADGASAILGRRVSPAAAALLAELLLLVAVARLGLLVRRRLGAEGTLLEVRRVGLRSVRVLLDPRPGVPFTGGIFRPFVCLPASLTTVLTPEEREAVIAHEIAHVRNLDVLLLGVVAAARAVFWFVPGVGWLARAIGRECELRADAKARQSVDPVVLASALVRVAETLPDRPAVTGAAPALLRRRSLLAARVEHLVTPVSTPSRARRLGRVVFTLLALGLVLRTQTFGP